MKPKEWTKQNQIGSYSTGNYENWTSRKTKTAMARGFYERLKKTEK
jgi:hypothetical protein